MNEIGIVPIQTAPLELVTRFAEALTKLDPSERAVLLEIIRLFRPKYIYPVQEP